MSQPRYSPDGNFWWDGRQWQPVQQNSTSGPTGPGPGPYQPGPYQPGPYQPGPHQPAWIRSGQPGPPPAGYWGPPPPRRRRRAPFIILGVVVLVLIVIAVPVVIHLARPAPKAAGYHRTSSPLEPGEPITQARLDKVSAQDFLWDQLTRQMTQPIAEVDSALFTRKSDYSSHDHYYLNQFTVDHTGNKPAGTGNFSAATTTYDKGNPPAVSRCVRDKYYTYWNADPTFGQKAGWRRVPDNDETCTLKHQRSLSQPTDGIVPSGLTPAQAGKELHTLREVYKGFAQPQRPTLITSGGKHYIRQVVDYPPIKLADNEYWGTQLFIWAFRNTDLSWETWPFSNPWASAAGLHVVSYYDTTTLLPVASKQLLTPPLNADGKPANDGYAADLFNYQFPKKYTPLTLKGHHPVKLTLPEGWKIP